jgi:hypothetical protein
MKKKDINIFGEASISHVEKKGLFSYAVIRDCDGKILAKSFKFRKYIIDAIRTMYTGLNYGTGDFILQADTINGSKEIYRWK